MIDIEYFKYFYIQKYHIYIIYVCEIGHYMIHRMGVFYTSAYHVSVLVSYKPLAMGQGQVIDRLYEQGLTVDDRLRYRAYAPPPK